MWSLCHVPVAANYGRAPSAAQAHADRPVRAVTVKPVRRRTLVIAGLLVASVSCTESETETVRDIREFGDVSVDGSRTLTRALSRAQRDGFAVAVPGDVEVRLAQPVTVGDGARLRGSGALVAVDDLPRMISIKGSRAALSGLSLRGGGHRVGTLVSVDSSAREVSLGDLVVDGAATGIAVSSGAQGLRVQGSTLSGVSCGVRLRGDVEDVLVRSCHFNRWEDRAVWVVGDARRAPREVVVDQCEIGPPSKHGAVRQAIQVNGHDDRLVRGVKITNNRVVGSGTSYDDPKRPGSADLISLHRCREFLVSANHVTDGGDVGITVSQQSRDGLVEDNVCRKNDSVGICIGSLSSTKVSRIVVRGNVCEGNGQDRRGDGKPWALAGILVSRGEEIDLEGNVARDTGQGGQVNAISLRHSNVSLKGNRLAAQKVTVRTDAHSKVVRR